MDKLTDKEDNYYKVFNTTLLGFIGSIMYLVILGIEGFSLFIFKSSFIGYLLSINTTASIVVGILIVVLMVVNLIVSRFRKKEYKINAELYWTYLIIILFILVTGSIWNLIEGVIY